MSNFNSISDYLAEKGVYAERLYTTASVALKRVGTDEIVATVPSSELAMCKGVEEYKQLFAKYLINAPRTT